MMREVTESEVKGCWSELLAAVEEGETVAIVRDGRAVAHLTPAAESVSSPEPLPQSGRIGKDYAVRGPVAAIPPEPTDIASDPQPSFAELLAETPEENYRRWLEARGPISESLQELLDWRRA